MVHPLLTTLFDIFLIGSTLAIVIGIALDTHMRREPSVGAVTHRRVPSADRRRTRPLTGRRLPSHRRGVMARS